MRSKENRVVSEVNYGNESCRSKFYEERRKGEI